MLEGFGIVCFAAQPVGKPIVEQLVGQVVRGIVVGPESPVEW